MTTTAATARLAWTMTIVTTTTPDTTIWTIIWVSARTSFMTTTTGIVKTGSVFTQGQPTVPLSLSTNIGYYNIKYTNRNRENIDFDWYYLQNNNNDIVIIYICCSTNECRSCNDWRGSNKFRGSNKCRGSNKYRGSNNCRCSKDTMTNNHRTTITTMPLKSTRVQLYRW